MEFSEERYTPLDYALLNSHHEVAQFMIEYGALSINGVRDIAAAKIQACDLIDGLSRAYNIRIGFKKFKINTDGMAI